MFSARERRRKPAVLTRDARPPLVGGNTQKWDIPWEGESGPEPFSPSGRVSRSRKGTPCFVIFIFVHVRSCEGCASIAQSGKGLSG